MTTLPQDIPARRFATGRAARSIAGRRRLGGKAMAFLPLLLLIAAWQAATMLRLLPPQILISPAGIFATFLDMLRSGELADNVAVSLYRLLIGFACGSAAGLAIGSAMGLSRLAERMVAPFFHAVRQIPVIAFIPLLILFFDVGDTFKIVVVGTASFFPVALATLDGIHGIPRSVFEVASLYRLPTRALLRHVVLPATVPAVLTGVRLGLMRAWLTLVASELLAADSGLGQMMEFGRQTFRIDVVMLGAIVTGVIGFLLDRSAIAAEARLTRWRTA